MRSDIPLSWTLERVSYVNVLLVDWSFNQCTPDVSPVDWRGVPLQEEPVPLAFFVRGEAEVVSSLGSCVKTLGVETEQVLPVVYQPQAVFRVRAVARCTSTLQGHTEAVISTAFSPTGK